MKEGAHYKRNFPFEKLKFKKKKETHSEVSGEPVAVQSCRSPELLVLESRGEIRVQRVIWATKTGRSGYKRGRRLLHFRSNL